LSIIPHWEDKYCFGNLKEKLLLWFCFFSLLVPLCFSFALGKETSGTTTLSPGEEQGFTFYVRKSDTLLGTVDVQSGIIDIYIVDSDNYPDVFYYEEMFTDVTGLKDFYFDTIYTDTYYVIFINYSSSESAVIQYTFNVDKGMPTWLISLIAVLALTAVVALMIFLIIKGKNI